MTYIHAVRHLPSIRVSFGNKFSKFYKSEEYIVIKAQETEQKFRGQLKRNPTKDLGEEKVSQDEDVPTIYDQHCCVNF